MESLYQARPRYRIEHHHPILASRVIGSFWSRQVADLAILLAALRLALAYQPGWVALIDQAGARDVELARRPIP